MEDKVKSMFDNLTMPEKCARRIADAMAQKQAGEKGMYMRKITENGRRREWIPTMAGMLCLALVLAWGLLIMQEPGEEAAESTGLPVETTVPDVQQRETEGMDKLLELQKRHENLDEDWDLQKVVEKFETTLSYTEGNRHYCIYRGGQDVRVEDNAELHTPFTECSEGKVYFIANGEYLDITGQFSEEEPFTYIFTDRMFMEHYIAIGGTAENPGWLEMVYTSWEEKPQSFVLGSGVNTWNNSADERYGWETKAKETFAEYGVHWPS